MGAINETLARLELLSHNQPEIRALVIRLRKQLQQELGK